MSTPVPVAEKVYMLHQTREHIHYYAEGSKGYGHCPDLDTLGAPHRMCRARVSKGVLTRIYAGLVPVDDPRASALRRRCGGTTYAYMKGATVVYKAAWRALPLNWLGHTNEYIDLLYWKRIEGLENCNLRVRIKSTGGKGWVRKVAPGLPVVQTLDFDENIGVHGVHEFPLLLDNGRYEIRWETELLGTTDYGIIDYPGTTPA